MVCSVSGCIPNALPPAANDVMSHTELVRGLHTDPSFFRELPLQKVRGINNSQEPFCAHWAVHCPEDMNCVDLGGCSLPQVRSEGNWVFQTEVSSFGKSRFDCGEKSSRKHFFREHARVDLFLFWKWWLLGTLFLSKCLPELQIVVSFLIPSLPSS